MKSPTDKPFLWFRWYWLLLVIPLAFGLVRVRLDVDVLNLLPGELPSVAGLKAYQKHFLNSRELILTLQGEDAEALEGQARDLASRLRALTNSIAGVHWQAPWREAPSQTAELIAYLWLNQSPGTFSQMAEELHPARVGRRLERVKEELATSFSPDQIARHSYDPFGLTQLPTAAMESAPQFNPSRDPFVSEDGLFRMVSIVGRDELANYRQSQEWIQKIQSTVSNWAGQLANPPRMRYTGAPAFSASIAKEMEKDLKQSILGTAGIIAVLFWLAHRRLGPLLWLLSLLAFTLVTTLALGGLLFHAINVVSMGFAAILLGLAVDYAVVHYQEALAEPDLGIPQIRRRIAPSIFWAATTTIAAFLMLNFGGLPGLAQLGTLVALGVGLAAVLMVFGYLPPLFPERRAAFPLQARQARPTQGWCPIPGSRFGMILSALALAGCAGLLLSGLPVLDSSSKALRPRKSDVYEAMDELRVRLGIDKDALWVIVSGADPAEVGVQLEQLRSRLEEMRARGVVASFSLPNALWPNPGNQAANRETAERLGGSSGTLRAALADHGFKADAFTLAGGVLDAWSLAAGQTNLYWPTNPVSAWIIQRVAATGPGIVHAIGLVQPAPGAPPGHELDGIDGVLVTGWERLGQAILERVRQNWWKVTLPMVLLVLVSLWLAFPSLWEMCLGAVVLGLGALGTLATMKLAGWSWNLLNLMAIPLILGTGVDYCIFMQHALRRYGGQVSEAWRAVGKALILCGATAIAGFGSLAFSNNEGIASLGRLCATGIAMNMLIAIFLLPGWWVGCWSRQGRVGNEVRSPSSLYQARLWKAGLWLARVLPLPVLHLLARFGGWLYHALAVHRRNVVNDNLLPAVAGDRSRARRIGRKLFIQFAVKLVDLWRYEAGRPVETLFGTTTGWENFLSAHAQGRGVLFLGAHVGNWELGGPWMTRKGYSLQILTQAEPDAEFTKLRQASRARWNVETLVIGNDPFAFLEVIKRLNNGATVALLIDRPPPATSVSTLLFGRPFDASIAAAELARATGCALLPIVVPRVGDAYQAHILPPVPYERGLLRDRSQRQQLTARIVQALEPAIARHLDQWYHFVPVWHTRSDESHS